METTQETNKRIAKNTLVLYLRMMVMMVLGFFTTRITLSALGVENYGIYNVVGGLVGMFALVSSSISAAISRFITYGLGTGKAKYLKDIFGASMNIQFALALIIVILFETVGLWFLNHKLVIPEDRMWAANIVFQLSVIGFVVSLMSLPYNACIIAHEKMSAFAFMTLFDAAAKLTIVFSLLYVNSDKLILYAVLLLAQGIISQIIYWAYCRSKFEECHYTIVKDKSLYKEIFSFSGWNFIGCSAALLSDQGVNIVLNMFFGPIVNTARGIGIQVNSILYQFSANFMTAINPQITKSYAAGDLDRTHTLIFKSAKLSFFLFLILSIPILLETRQALMIWLGQVPEYAVGFARLAILLTWSNTLSNPLITAQVATGKIRNYQLAVGTTYLMNLPISYVALKLGQSPLSVMVVAITISQVCMMLRLWFLRHMISISMRKFLKTVYLKVILVTLLSLPLPLVVYFTFEESFVRLVAVTLLSVLCTACVVYNIGCDNSEKIFVKDQLFKIRQKLRLA